MRWITPVLWLAIAGSVAAQAAEGSRHAGAHFEAALDYAAPRDAERITAVADAAWEDTLRLTGLRAPRRERPLAVHLYRTSAAYRTVDRRLTGGTFAKNGAFAHWDSLSAHVELAPRMDDAGRAKIGPTFHTLRLVAHEAAHLTCFAAMANHRSHPEWFSEGIATNVTEIVAKRLGLVERIEHDPYFCRKMMRVKALAHRNTLPTAKEVALDDIDRLHWLDAYAVRWAFFRVLRLDRPKRLRRYVAIVRRLRETSRFTGACWKTLVRTFGRRTLDDALRKAAKGFAPQWVEINRSLETAGAEWHHAAFPKSNAITWRIAPAGDADYVVRGEMTFGTARAQSQMNVLIDRQRRGFVSVAFQPSWLTVLEYDAVTKKWRKIHTRKLAPPAAGARRAFAVKRRRRTLEIEIDGEKILTASLPQRTLGGPWGLGVQAGDWGIWHDVRFESE